MVSFEVGRTGGKGGHAHIQVRDPSSISTYPVLMGVVVCEQILPIPNSLADQVENCFREEGSKTGITFEEESDASRAVTDGYFKAGLPDGRILVHLIEPGQRFNLQFGR